jgi:hypothetical protein
MSWKRYTCQKLNAMRMNKEEPWRRSWEKWGLTAEQIAGEMDSNGWMRSKRLLRCLEWFKETSGNHR